MDEKPRKRKVGPMLPMPGIGPAGGPESEEEDGDDQDGPRMAGAERAGVDLDDLPEASRREEWMTTPHASMAAAFSDGPVGRKTDQFQVSRSAEEQAAFEKAFSERAATPSLLQQVVEGAFADAEGRRDHAQRLRKESEGARAVWGLSTREQDQVSQLGAKAPPSQRAFDPEQDLQVRKPMAAGDFAKLVENSGSALAGRFGRGQVATSFL